MSETAKTVEQLIEHAGNVRDSVNKLRQSIKDICTILDRLAATIQVEATIYLDGNRMEGTTMGFRSDRDFHLEVEIFDRSSVDRDKHMTSFHAPGEMTSEWLVRITDSLPRFLKWWCERMEKSGVERTQESAAKIERALKAIKP